jgi:hypothetical protein
LAAVFFALSAMTLLQASLAFALTRIHGRIRPPGR